MSGAYGGRRAGEGEDREEGVATAVVEALRGDPAAPALTAAAGAGGAAALVPVAPGDEPGTLRLGPGPGDLTRQSVRGLQPGQSGLGLQPGLDLRVLERGEGLRALLFAARAVRRLHAEGRVHGDLRPHMLRAAPGAEVTLLVPARPVAASALLRARLGAGALPEETAWAAPEVVAGEEATPAADVYALAALTYGLLARRPPLGMLEVGRAAEGLPYGVAGALTRALAPDPARRPALGELIGALEKATGLAPEEGEEPLEGEGGLLQREPARPGQVSLLLLLVLLLGGAFTFVGALAFVAIGWDALSAAGRCALLCLFNLGVYGAGRFAEGRGYQRSGFVLVLLASQLLWACLAFLLDLQDLADEAGPWTLASLLVSGVGLALATTRRSATFATFSAGGFLAASLCGGAWLSRGSDLGPPLWLGLTAGAYAGLAGLGHRLGGARLGVPYALAGAMVGLVSGFWGLGILADGHDHTVFGALWPYVVGAAGLGAAFAARGVYRWCALLPGLLLAGSAPTLEALVRYDTLGYLYAAVAVGLLLCAASFKLPALAESDTTQLPPLLLGLMNACVAPAILGLAKCGGRDGMDLLRDALASLGRVHETRFVYLAIVLGISAGLVGLGILFAPLARRKLPYRLLEGAGVALFLFELTCLSLSENDLLYPALVFLGGGALLGLGIYQRRAALATLATGGLILNLWIQYFQKLSDALPVSLLCVGFGLALLACGVLYERKVRHMLPALASWA